MRDPVRSGVRAPYTLNVTYTMQREGDAGKIVTIVMDPAELPV
jgi:hypothetical protein